MERPSKHELTSWAFVLSNQFPFEEARKHPASRAGTTCEHSRDCSRPTGGFLCLRNSGFLRESRTVTRRRLLRRGDGRRSLCLPPFPFKRTGGGNCRAGPQAAASILYCRGIDQKLKKKKEEKNLTCTSSRGTASTTNWPLLQQPLKRERTNVNGHYRNNASPEEESSVRSAETGRAGASGGEEEEESLVQWRSSPRPPEKKRRSKGSGGPP